MDTLQTTRIPQADGPDEPPDPAVAAVKTWRYLRLSMVVLVIGLGASVLIEVSKADNCWQSSISAYYYTPVQGFFVGTLLAVGVCLIALKGNTEWEDVLLNLAGVCAPIVALVPTPNPGNCGSVLTDTTNRDLNIANNVGALLVAGALGLVLLAVLATIGRYRSTTPRRAVERPSTTAVVGFCLIALLWMATTVAFFSDRDWFTEYGHPIAAISMFVFIFLNVTANAFNSRRSEELEPAQRRLLFASYGAVAVAMVIATGVTVYLGLVREWDDWVLGLEASLIILFAVYWAIQTAELWNKGLRDESPIPATRDDGGRS